MLTKSQVVAHLAEKSGIQKKVAAGLMEELVALATKECKSGGQFVIPGLGKAVKANRKARMGRNPQTGAPVKIAASKVVRFSPASAYKEALNSRSKAATAKKAAPAKKSAPARKASAKKAPAKKAAKAAKKR